MTILLQFQGRLADGHEVCRDSVSGEPVEQGDVHLPEGDVPYDV